MYDVLYIAKWFLNRDRITSSLADSDGVSNLKLQKLLYYAQGTFLAVKGEKLFEDDLLAWTHGPVVESVYHAYKAYGYYPIDFDEDYSDADIADEDKSLLEDVYQSFAGYSAWGLREMTHNEAPWKETPQGEAIDPVLIKDYFECEIINWGEGGYAKT
ncbi:MAG: DUF4065 domain-containing protein [Clostridiales Family XIII bacterium]|jgi:uncharacterized phage-associated protein|nr:DUF4065 domain-containing protein [Clostridiales Family XIII bacterium]